MLKILISGAETDIHKVAVASSLDLAWPEAVAGLFSAFDWLSADAQLFAFDCELSEEAFGSK